MAQYGVIDWEWMLVLGVFIGAFLSAKLSGGFQGEWVPAKWTSTFGSTPFIRWIVALIGGIIMGIGARWAGGCTSGHGISGTLQLTVGSWLAAICFFIGGIAGMLIGAGLFAEMYPKLERSILIRGHFGELTWPQLLKVNPWGVIIPVAIGITALLFWIDKSGL